jgi:hypothetical protein
MMEGLQGILWLVVVGFLLTTIVGLVATWIVRKVSALVQWRVGQGDPYSRRCPANRLYCGAAGWFGGGFIAFDDAVEDCDKAGANLYR